MRNGDIDVLYEEWKTKTYKPNNSQKCLKKH